MKLKEDNLKGMKSKMTTKKEIGFKNILFLIIAILLVFLLVLKIIEKDLTSIIILAINSIIILIVYLILRKHRKKMLKTLDEDLNQKLEEIKKRGRKYKKPKS